MVDDVVYLRYTKVLPQLCCTEINFTTICSNYYVTLNHFHKIFPKKTSQKCGMSITFVVPLHIRRVFLHIVQDEWCQASREIFTFIECLTILQMGQYWKCRKVCVCVCVCTSGSWSVSVLSPYASQSK